MYGTPEGNVESDPESFANKLNTMVQRVYVFQDIYTDKKPKFMEPIKTIEVKKAEKKVNKSFDINLASFL